MAEGDSVTGRRRPPGGAISSQHVQAPVAGRGRRMMASKRGAGTRSGSSGAGRVRASRDGDRFHYTWAATQLLRLLRSTSSLQQISIEGLGTNAPEEEPAGAEVIDLVEYHGNAAGDFSELVVRQFKHSTYASEQQMSRSDVLKILDKFGKIDQELRERYPDARICFSIVTNTPISIPAVDFIAEIAGSDSAVTRAAGTIDDETIHYDLVSLCSRLELRGEEPSVTALRRGLEQGVHSYIADTDIRVSANLVDLVASRASTETNGPIGQADVLAAFGCRQDEIAPAPSRLDTAPFLLRDSYTDLAAQIMETPGPVVLTAEGGVGKSTFARALPDLLHDKADVLIYDCFGQGSYRRPDRPRHRHRDGLVQIANEISGLGLSLPLIHAGNVPPEEYVKAFVRRLEDASAALTAGGERQLVIVVDAADNAVMAAEDNADSRPFVRDLLRLEEAIPANVRILLTCRPERLDLLQPPDSTCVLSLDAFTEEETSKIVRNLHPSAAIPDVVEIHDRSAGNPRVVSTVLSETASIRNALDRITGLDGSKFPLDALMQDRVASAFDNAGGRRAEIERVAQLLTLLRPSVPVAILADLAGTHQSTVRSFISDLGRGLILNRQDVQFLDEPTETYFRTRHTATPQVAALVAVRLRELSGASAYAASSLPEVLWSAGLHDELLALVATDDALPVSDIERTQVEHLRIDFGLRAAVRLHRTDAIVQLAMRAGASRAGKGRQFTVIRDNPDIAGSRIEGRVLNNLIASREIPQSWPGSTLGSEAVMLAHSGASLGAARSRARQAASSLSAWVQRPRERHSRQEDVTPAQVAYIALALLRTDGPGAAVDYLTSWRPDRFMLESSAALARLLVSQMKYSDLRDLIDGSSHPALTLGLFGEMQLAGIDVEHRVAEVAWGLLKRFRLPLISHEYDQQVAEDTAFRGASWLCALAVRHRLATTAEAGEILGGCLPTSPPHGLGERHNVGRLGLLYAIALRAELKGEVLDVGHYRPVENVVERGGSTPVGGNRDNADRYLVSSLRWLTAWAKFALGDLDPEAAVDVVKSFPGARYDEEPWSLTPRLARQIMPLVGSAFKEEPVVAACIQAIRASAAIAPIAGAQGILLGLRGDTRFEAAALELANAARLALADAVETGDVKAEALVRIARGLYSFSQAEAGHYFDQAVRAASGVGEDAIYRWDAIVSLTKGAAGIRRPEAIFLADRVARLGELIEPVVDRGIDQGRLVAALASLSGANVLRIMGQWRDRRFGLLDRHFRGLVTGDDALLSDRPELRIALAPFAPGIDLSAALRELESRGPVDLNVRSSLNDLAARLGISLDFPHGNEALPDPRRDFRPPVRRSSTFDLAPAEQEERLAKVERCRASLAGLNFAESGGIDTALKIHRESHAFGEDLLSAEVFSRPQLQWSSILDAAGNSVVITPYELAALLNAGMRAPRTSQSFEDSLVNAITAYVHRFGTRILQGDSLGLDVSMASEVLGIGLIDLQQRALSNLNLEEVLTDSYSCYSLAAGASAVLEPADAARVLRDAVATFEIELGASLGENSSETAAVAIDDAVANYLWAALGDTRSTVRWLAAHAVRTIIEVGLETVVKALGSAVLRGGSAGYADERFVFYEMNAAEWFLIAVERVARDYPDHVIALKPAIVEISFRYPDHATIQRHCNSISRWLNSPSGWSTGTDWSAELAPPEALHSWDRPRPPAPMMKGAPRSEYRFHFDFDEYVIGRLSGAFVVSHQEVLDAASQLILDEWGWRGTDGGVEDLRRTAAVYEDGETYAYKGEVPRAESLEYYLERNAALTIAGRLMRTTVPYSDPDLEHADVLVWIAGFDIARDDGRWIVDQRTSVPDSLSSIGQGGSHEVEEVDFLAAANPADGWVVVWQSASVTEYSRSLGIEVASGLVTTESSGALVRALQTGAGYWSFRIPSSDPDDEEYRFSSAPFNLRGWISKTYSEGGIDRFDQLARELTPYLPGPSPEIAGLLGVTSEDGGLRWRSEDGGAICMAAETWADVDSGREPHGPSGYRLRIANDALDEILEALDAVLIVEVRVRRESRGASYHDVLEDENVERGDDDRASDFRIFSYRPRGGWSDSQGSVRFGQTSGL